MKKIFVRFMLVIVLATNCMADGFLPMKNGYTRKNIHGGQNYYQGSKQVMSSRKNCFQGQNYYSGSKLVTSSRKNVFSGQTFKGGK